MTCPLCRRVIEVLEAVKGKGSFEQARIVKEPAYVWHLDATGAQKCPGSFLTVSKAAALAFPHRQEAE